MNDTKMKIIGYIHTDFKEKFGLPRQSGLIESLTGEIVFLPEFRTKDAFRGLDEFSHIWVLWKFSESERKTWSATVKPPRLGGNKRMGVFATRSPFRPNDIGLSCVRLNEVCYDEKNGTTLKVSGIDMMDGTPVYDIKPYLPYADSKVDATGGFAARQFDYALEVVFPEELLLILPKEKRESAVEVLKQDPRPAYQDDPDRKYGVAFAGYDIRFYVRDGVLSVCEVENL